MSDGDFQNPFGKVWETDDFMNMKGLKYDQNKIDYSLIPVESLREIANVFTHGKFKYGKDNWKLFKPEDHDRLYSACMRHLEAIREGQTKDPESGINHIYHAIANLIMWSYLTRNES